jgi:hypothetical protein
VRLDQGSNQARLAEDSTVGMQLRSSTTHS